MPKKATDLHEVSQRLTEGLEPPPRKAQVKPRSIRGRIVAGVLLVIPLGITAILISYVYEAILSVGISLVNWVAYFTSIGLNWAFQTEILEEKVINPDDAVWYIKLSAVVLTLMMLYLLGWLGSNVVGRTIIEFFESMLERIPLVDTVYGALKRMVHSLSGGGAEDAKRVVLIDFPTDHMKAIAFQTNTLTDRITGQKYATVYVPTTPNPTSGYMELVPVERITETDWSMEEALSMILSGGAKAPDHVNLKTPEVRQAAAKKSAAGEKKSKRLPK